MMNYSIQRKLLFWSGLTIAALSISVFYSFFTNRTLDAQHIELQERLQYRALTSEMLVLHARMESDMAHIHDEYRNNPLSIIAPERPQAMVARIDAVRQGVGQLELRRTPSISAGQVALVKNEFAEIDQLAAQFLNAVAKHSPVNDTHTMYEALLARSEALRRHLYDIDQAASTGVEIASEAIDQRLNTTTSNLLLGYISLLLVLLILLPRLGQSIVQPLRQLSADIRRLSTGDYRKEFNGADRGDEIAEMASALNANVHRIREVTRTIREAARAVDHAATEIATSNSDLAERTAQQAGSLQQTVASMSKIAGSVQQNAQNARNADALASNANALAANGGAVVAQAIDAMGTIEKSSRKINDIISVIDEIAFQTNLLALNAAVEAARAGEVGKGFAVVASEVRVLAGRSAKASKEIKALISESSAQVKAGSSLVNQTGETLKEIVTAVHQVANIISEITSAGAQQSDDTHAINSAIAQMDHSTQQNAALVERSSATAQSMLQQSKQLEASLRFFQLDEASARPVTPAAQPAAQAAATPAPRIPTPTTPPKQKLSPVAIAFASAAIAEQKANAVKKQQHANGHAATDGKEEPILSPSMPLAPLSSAGKTAKPQTDDQGWEEF
jgi:methyl-accepting chemotaxis protein